MVIATHAAEATTGATLLSLGAPTYFDARHLQPYVCGLPWPHADASIEQASITHVLEYLPGPDRVHFVNELWRVLQPGGRATLHVPFWSSPNAHADPYLAWPPISELSLQYLTDAGFRARNQLGYSELCADFGLVWGVSYAPEWHVRSDSTRTFAHQHYLATVTQIVATLTKRPVEIDEG